MKFNQQTNSHRFMRREAEEEQEVRQMGVSAIVTLKQPLPKPPLP